MKSSFVLFIVFGIVYAAAQGGGGNGDNDKDNDDGGGDGDGDGGGNDNPPQPHKPPHPAPMFPLAPPFAPLRPPVAPPSSSDGDDNTIVYISVGVAGAVLLLFVLGTAAYWSGRKRAFRESRASTAKTLSSSFLARDETAVEVVSISEGQQAPLSRAESGRHWEIAFSELKLGARIGVGSFGECFKAEWNGTPVAVKRLWDVMGGAHGRPSTVMEDLNSEIAILRNLRHPNVVLFMGSCRAPPDMCIVMEYCPRGSLDKVLYEAPPAQLDRKRRMKMLLQAARGMQFLHSLTPPLVHRDLKPGNLLVTNNYDIKVCDFGISMSKTKTLASATASVGTPQYAAPEIMMNNPYTEKIDVWSFGMIVWEVTAAQRPFAHLSNVLQVINAVVMKGERPPPLMEMPSTRALWHDSGEALLGLHQLQLECTDTDATKRPSFDAIQATIEKLFTLVGKGPDPESLNPELVLKAWETDPANQPFKKTDDSSDSGPKEAGGEQLPSRPAYALANPSARIDDTAVMARPEAKHAA